MSEDAARKAETDSKPEAPEKAAADKPKDKQFKAGVAVGIGSAAIVAALLYARSNKPRKK